VEFNAPLDTIQVISEAGPRVHTWKKIHRRDDVVAAFLLVSVVIVTLYFATGVYFSGATL